MSRAFIFDIDGTLTPSRLRMLPEFEEFFKDWASNHNFFLVTGSDIVKTKEQVPVNILGMAQAIYCCCGNVHYYPSSFHSQPTLELGPVFFEKRFSMEFNPPQDLLDYLESELESSSYPKRCGNHIELRQGMVNFSIVGRDCNLEERKDFYEWDKKFTKRDRIAAHITKKWKNLDASLGGQISVDIYPKGKDKSQVLNKIIKSIRADEYIFIADKTYPGGNDYPLAAIMQDKDNCTVKHVDSWEDTLEYLKNPPIIIS